MPATAAMMPIRTIATTTRPAPGMRWPLFSATVTAATPSRTPRTTAITPPPSQRSAARLVGVQVGTGLRVLGCGRHPSMLAAALLAATT